MHLPALNRKKDALSRPLFKKKKKKIVSLYFVLEMLFSTLALQVVVS